MRSKTTSNKDRENRETLDNTGNTAIMEPMEISREELWKPNGSDRRTINNKAPVIPKVRTTNKPDMEKPKKVEVSQNQVKENVEPKQEINVVEIAEEIMKETGRLPGRRKLMERAGCSEWVARQTVATLKQQFV